jgi:hypothetical protein
MGIGENQMYQILSFLARIIQVIAFKRMKVLGIAKKEILDLSVSAAILKVNYGVTF